MNKQVQQIKAEIERHLECVLDFIDSLPEDHIADASKMAQEESVSKDLEKVFGQMAEAYYNDVLLEEHQMPEAIAHKCRLSYFRGLKAGANYQKQQDEKDTSGMLIVAYLRGGDEGKKIMVDKACEWLNNFFDEHIIISYSDCHEIDNSKELIEIFKRKMEE